MCKYGLPYRHTYKLLVIVQSKCLRLSGIDMHIHYNPWEQLANAYLVSLYRAEG